MALNIQLTTGHNSFQGAAQALEDAATLGYLFSNLTHKSQIKGALKSYEAIRTPRTSRILDVSKATGAVYQLPDGAEQQKRDEELLKTKAGDIFPECMIDEGFQSWLLQH